MVAIRLLEVLGVPKHGYLSSLSARLAKLLQYNKSWSNHVFLQPRSSLLVLTPLYFDKGQYLHRLAQESRLSLISLLATWRAGGVVAPVTPQLLAQPQNIHGYIPDYSPAWAPEVASFVWRFPLCFRSGSLELFLGLENWMKFSCTQCADLTTSG